MEVALEGVGAGLGDAVPERDGGDEGRHRPGRREETRAETHEPREEEGERRHVQRQEPGLEARRHQPDHAGEDLVGEHQARLHLEEHPVAREEARIELSQDRRDVGGLITDAVAVAGGVEGGGDGEEDAAGGEREHGEAASRSPRGWRLGRRVHRRTSAQTPSLRRSRVAGSSAAGTKPPSVASSTEATVWRERSATSCSSCGASDRRWV